MPQPTTAQNGVADLHAFPTAANEPGPYVLVGASWGGLIAKLYASTYPDQVAGLILVDFASEFFQEALIPEQWADWMQLIRQSKSADKEVPDYESSVTQIRNVSSARIIPSVVLTFDNPGTFSSAGSAPASQPGWRRKTVSPLNSTRAHHPNQQRSWHCRRATSNRYEFCS